MDFAGLTITIGCPGSGKSTWAAANVPAETCRLERDRFRECLFGSRRAYHESPIERTVRSSIITAAMTASMAAWPFPSWAVTDTGLMREAVQPFIFRAWENWPDAQPVRLVVFERDPEYLRLNNRIRAEEHRVPDDLLEQCIEQFFDPEAWWRHTGMETIYAPRIAPLKVA